MLGPLQRRSKREKVSKSITIISQNFYPEDSAIGLYSSQMAAYLREKGFEVKVLAGYPYYPQWKIWEGYAKGALWSKENYEGCQVYRFKQYTPAQPSFMKRILHLSSFMLGSFPNLLRSGRSDIIFVVLPFVGSISLGIFAKWIWRSRLWIHVQDFEVDAAMETGLFDNKKSFLKRAVFKAESLVMQQANIASTISNLMMEKLKIKAKQDPVFLPNWIDVQAMESVKSDAKHPYVDPNKFCLLYSGNIGEKQNWDYCLELIKRTEDLKDQLHWTIVGAGAKRDEFQEKIREYPHVSLHPLVAFEELPLLLRSADVHFLLQKAAVKDTVMPSKVLGMMGSGKPSFIFGHPESEVRVIVEESEGGHYYHEWSAEKVLEDLFFLMKNKEEAHQMGVRAKEYIERNFAKNKVLDKLVMDLNERLD